VFVEKKLTSSRKKGNIPGGKTPLKKKTFSAPFEKISATKCLSSKKPTCKKKGPTRISNELGKVLAPRD